MRMYILGSASVLAVIADWQFPVPLCPHPRMTSPVHNLHCLKSGTSKCRYAHMRRSRTSAVSQRETGIPSPQSSHTLGIPQIIPQH